MITPGALLAHIRWIYPERYLEGSGGCYKVYRLLKAAFPSAEGYYNSEHCITRINGRYWDIDGEVLNIDGFLPMDHFGPMIHRIFRFTRPIPST